MTLKECINNRITKLQTWLINNEFGAAVFVDSEEHRDPSVSYLANCSGDCVLVVPDFGSAMLIPWDEILAKKNAVAGKIVPFTKYKNNAVQAVKGALKAQKKNIEFNRICLPNYFTYHEFLDYVEELENWEVVCEKEGAVYFLEECRMEKDEYELECIKKACAAGDEIIDEIEERVRDGRISTETDVALYIEKALREKGCQRTGFDTLAAGPERSFAIHAFPGYTNAPWPAQGLSILDFGVVYQGYTSDTTLTIAKGPLTPEQEEQLSLVETAYNECLKLYRPGELIKNACAKADSIFAKAGRKMPHTLGHAIGLEIHEKPRVSTRDEEITFRAGMVLTLEPGLYDETIGGTRWENDVLITDGDPVVLTHSRIIRL